MYRDEVDTDAGFSAYAVAAPHRVLEEFPEKLLRLFSLSYGRTADAQRLIDRMNRVFAVIVERKKVLRVSDPVLPVVRLVPDFEVPLPDFSAAVAFFEM